ncbi:hypothetical protein Pelo_17745 [Pelomyxa schiedti]|nr:hypothetical protein Pelo_17745 [Pelomyxa schiedti]
MSFADFREAFEEYFLVDDEALRCKGVMHLRKKKDESNESFGRRLKAKTHNVQMSEAVKVEVFMDGIDSADKDELEKQTFDTLNDAIAMAKRLELIRTTKAACQVTSKRIAHFDEELQPIFKSPNANCQDVQGMWPNQGMASNTCTVAPVIEMLIWRSFKVLPATTQSPIPLLQLQHHLQVLFQHQLQAPFQSPSFQPTPPFQQTPPLH